MNRSVCVYIYGRGGDLAIRWSRDEVQREFPPVVSVLFNMESSDKRLSLRQTYLLRGDREGKVYNLARRGSRDKSRGTISRGIRFPRGVAM